MILTLSKRVDRALISGSCQERHLLNFNNSAKKSGQIFSQNSDRSIWAG